MRACAGFAIRRLAVPLLAAGWLFACGAPADTGVRIQLIADPTATPLARAATATVSAPPASAPHAALTVAPPLAAAAATPPARVIASTIAPARTPAAAGRPPVEREDAQLRAVIVAALGSDADHAGVVVKRLTDGAVARVNSEKVFYAASLYKLAVLYEAFDQRDRGLLDFDRRVVLTGKYTAEDLGTLGSLPLDAAGAIAVEDAVGAMVTLSDNASATLLLDLLGHRTIDAALLALGLRDTSVNTTELPTTAADMARLMEAVVRGEGLRPEAAAQMTALLLKQETRAGIPRGLPAGVPVGNKTGTWSGATHDVAVVFAPSGAYVLAVLTEGSWAWEPIARVSRAVYDYWQPAGVRQTR